MFTISYIGSDRSLWHLDGPQAGSEGVFLKSFSGFSGVRSRASITGPGRVGVVRTGKPSAKNIEGTLSVVVSARVAGHGRRLPEILRSFRRAFSDSDGELEITSSEGASLWLPVHLSDALPELEASPFDGTVPWIEFDVDVESDSIWRGVPRTYSGENQVLFNDGEVDAWPVITYTGSPTVSSNGVSIQLPSTSVEAVFDTDPGKGGVISVGGTPNPALWSQLRGRTFPLPVPPSGNATWSFGAGSTAQLTPRYLDPWRW